MYEWLMVFMFSGHDASFIDKVTVPTITECRRLGAEYVDLAKKTKYFSSDNANFKCIKIKVQF